MLDSHIARALSKAPDRIVITGASGWLGRATLDMLHEALGSDFAHRVKCFGSVARPIELPGFSIDQRPLDEIIKLDNRPTLVLHLAFLTKDRAEVMNDAEYSAANRQIRTIVLEALEPIGARAVFIASSGAAAFADSVTASPAMRLYGSLKREDEEAFDRWSRETGKKAVIARIYNLSGPHINKVESYALSSFILAAQKGGPVAVKAAHDVRRGYVAIRQLVSLVFAMLLDGRPGTSRFDTGGEPVELGDLAHMVAKVVGGGCGVARPDRTDSPADDYLGDSNDFRRRCEDYGVSQVSLTEQIVETAQFIVGFQSHSATNRMVAGARS